jgi:hypothetical protein
MYVVVAIAALAMAETDGREREETRRRNRGISNDAEHKAFKRAKEEGGSSYYDLQG